MKRDAANLIRDYLWNLVGYGVVTALVCLWVNWMNKYIYNKE